MMHTYIYLDDFTLQIPETNHEHVPFATLMDVLAHPQVCRPPLSLAFYTNYDAFVCFVTILKSLGPFLSE